MLICLTSLIFKFSINSCFSTIIKFNGRNIIFNQRPDIVKTSIINTVYTVQEAHLWLFSFSAKVI